MVKFFKVGGMKFVRVGKLQISWCICGEKRAKPVKYKKVQSLRAARKAFNDALLREQGMFASKDWRDDLNTFTN
jgi:hypothetical protein